MSNVRLSWVLPSVSQNQKPLASVRIEARAEGIAQFTQIQEVDVPTTELLLQDVPSGTIQYRAFVVDQEGAVSAPTDTSATVPFDGPDVLVSFSATVE